MQHFDILASKYGIDEHLQTQELFSKEELNQWLEGYASFLYETGEKDRVA